MKIRCGSHQQNRSIVRPGLSLMATKVALTAEEFRENSQRSIALFNTEKLSTDSTHVLKSAYCILCISAVAICTERVEAKSPFSGRARINQRCNLHGACGGKGRLVRNGVEVAFVAICTERVEAKKISEGNECQPPVAICTERVEAKNHSNLDYTVKRVAICTRRVEDLASSSEKNPRKFMQTYCIFIHLGV